MSDQSTIGERASQGLSGAAPRCRRILVTGASGFVGSKLLFTLVQSGARPVGLVRRPSLRTPDAELIAVGDLQVAEGLQGILSGMDAVVHLAGRAHLFKDRSADPLAEFRAANVEGTRRLAKAAVAAGVRRFVFVSSIGVNGRCSADRPFRAGDPPQPRERYAVSKLEAELLLQGLAHECDMEVCVVRPPLVYGPNAPGNLGRLRNALARGLPIPIVSQSGKRSFIGVENLCDFLLQCATHPAAAGETFLVSDGEDVSMECFIRSLARAMGRRARLVPVSQRLLRWATRLAGRKDDFERLVAPLQIDPERSCRILGWSPPVAFAEGIRRAAATDNGRRS